jgi:hypothetical protein
MKDNILKGIVIIVILAGVFLWFQQLYAALEHQLYWILPGREF